MAKKLKSIKEFITESAKEVADGITIEKLSPMYFNMAKLVHQPAPIYRMDSSNHRYYYRLENDEPIFYTSVTTMIKNTLPTSPHLIKWLVDQQGDGADVAMERASYGSFLHAECASLLITGRYDLDTLQERLVLFMAKEKTTIKPGWVDDLKKDILAFAQFVIDTKCEPLAIEIILYHPTDGYAGAIDLVCSLEIEEKGFFGETYASGVQKGLPKETKQVRRVNAILDIKSGRKAFYESAEIQLQAYFEMFQIHFPDIRIERLLNWSPKDFRTTPSYNLKDQSESKNRAKLKHLVELSKIEDDKKDKKVTIVSGHIDLTKGLSGNIEEISFTDLVKKNK